MNNDFTKIVGAEIFKLRRQKTPYILGVLVALLAMFLFFALEVSARKNWLGVPSGHFVAASAIGWLTTVMMLLAVIIASFLIAQEFTFGTIKSTWVRPVARGQWYTAKIFTVAAAITELFLGVVVLVVLLAAVRLGFTDLTEKNFVVHSAQTLAGHLSLSIGLTILGLWGVVVYVAMIATIVNHPGGAIATSLGIGVVLFVGSAFPAVRPFLLTTYVAAPLDQMVAMSKGVPLPFEWSTLVWQTVAGVGTWIGVSFFVGYRNIRRKEITS